MIAVLVDGFRDATEVIVTALGSLTLFCLCLAFLKTWMRGGS